MSTKKIIIITVSVLLIGLIVWYFFFKKLKKATPVTVATLPTPTSTLNAPTQMDNDSFPLKVGSKGTNVKTLQGALNALKPLVNLDLVEDGDFGAHTQIRLTQMYGANFYPLTETNFDTILTKANSKLSTYNN